MLKEDFFNSDGVKLHYLNWGGTGNTLLLLPGLGGTAQYYRGLAPRLIDQFRVVGLTRRGHGRSDKPDSGYDLDTFVEDILCFTDALEIDRTVLVGHSFAGLEMPRFAIRYHERLSAIVFLDALFPPLDNEPDFSDDPVWSIPPEPPTNADLASLDAYLTYYRNAYPDLDRIWCSAIEADLMDKIIIHDNGTVENHHDDELMNEIAAEIWPFRNPEYNQVMAPMLAIVPNGDYHHGISENAPLEKRRIADQYWKAKILPWIQHRTDLFRQAAPSAQILELNAPNHYIFIAEEDHTVKAIKDFLAN